MNASSLSPSGIEFALFEWEAHKDQIYSISMSNARLLDITTIQHVLSNITQRGLFRYLVELNLSYIQMSKSSLDCLCFYVNPVTSGFCPIRRLILTHCTNWDESIM